MHTIRYSTNISAQNCNQVYTEMLSSSKLNNVVTLFVRIKLTHKSGAITFPPPPTKVLSLRSAKINSIGQSNCS